MKEPCRTNHTHKKPRRGATAVEFAVVAPVFFLLVFGVIEFGRIMMIQHSVTNAAILGCRMAVLASSDNSEEVEATVRSALQSVLPFANDQEKVRVNVPDISFDTAPGTELTVSVEVDFADSSWLPINYLGINPTIGAVLTQERE